MTAMDKSGDYDMYYDYPAKTDKDLAARIYIPIERDPERRPAGATSARLASVTAVSPSIAWAVGQADYPHHVTRLLIERWDGSSWNLVPVPNPTP
jgi:hypothetical protein